MERRMNFKDLAKDLEQVVQSIQEGEVVIIERQTGQRNPDDLVLITRKDFDRLQAGQRNPDITPNETANKTTAGQRNPD